MRGDEKEKCLEKLCEMQSFLPFLDFMIDKIKKKNVFPLECQLSKFQHIRSVILEKNGKYSLEGLTNIEDILQKLITKLDYKGPGSKFADVKPELISPSDGSNKNENDSFSEEVFEITASTRTTSTVFDIVKSTSSKTDSSNNNIHMVMKNTDPTVGQASEDCGEKRCGENSRDLNTVECSTGLDGVCLEKRLNQIEAEKPPQQTRSSTVSDVLALSRKKLLSSVSGKTVTGIEFNSKNITNANSSRPKDNTVSNLKRTSEISDSVKGKKKNVLFDELSNEFSDISDDEYIVSEDVEPKNNNVRSVERKKYSGDKSKSVCEKLDSKNGEHSSTLSISSNDVSNKQKLREKLSADIAAVHKVPGKSVGGSLRLLKDGKNTSQEIRESEPSKERRKSRSQERNSEHRDSQLRLRDESDKNRGSTSIRKEHKKKDHKSKSQERKKEEKHHRKSEEEEEEEEEKTGNDKRSPSSTRQSVEKKERKKRLEIDKLNDEELAAFVNENISAFPHLSKLKTDELRRIARSSLLSEELDSEGNSSPAEDASNENDSDKTSEKCENMTDEEKKSALGSVQSIPVILCGEVQASNNSDDDDEFARALIEQTTPVAFSNCGSDKTEQLRFRATSSGETVDSSVRQYPLKITPSVPEGSYQPNSQTPPFWGQVSTNQVDCRLPSQFPNQLGDPGVSWNINVGHENTFSNRPNFCVQGNVRIQTFDCSSYEANNTMQRQFGAFNELSAFPGYGNTVRHQIQYSAPEPKSYGEYKQMKRQGQENSNKLRLSHDERSVSLDVGTTEQSLVENRNLKVLSPTNSTKSIEEKQLVNKSGCDQRGNKMKQAKPLPRGGMDSQRKPTEGDKHQEDKTDKSNSQRFSSQEDELISPLDKLYENEPKLAVGRGYGLQNFKIPKKNRSGSGESPRDEHTRTGEGRVPVTGEIENDGNKAKSSDAKSQDSKVELDSSLKKSSEGNAGKNDSNSFVDTNKENNEQVNKVSENVCKSPTKGLGHDVKLSKSQLDSANTRTEGKDNACEKNSMEAGRESESASDKSLEKEKPKTDASDGKSSITEEITQELVETLITKSFESGEGELLLAKAKLFKELACKLNSKKLKTIQKIINSESDSSSSSSDSSTESKRRAKKKKSGDGGKKEKRKKNSQLVIYSSEDESGDIALTRSTEKKDSSSNEVKSISPEKTSPEKGSKKIERKTKLLQQIFDESPGGDLGAIAIQNQEKDTDQRIKSKPSRLTELERLHEDIRNMFICSGVVTATGQRMCRILRESGGKVNNLDLVKESAKMVEEEKLAMRLKSRILVTRSRSRSLERRSAKKNIATNDKCKKLVPTKDLPVVTLTNVDLRKWSYTYKIAGFDRNYMSKKGRNVARRGRRQFRTSERGREIQFNRRRKVYMFRNLQKHHVMERLRHRKVRPRRTVRSLTEILQHLPLKISKMKNLDISSAEPNSTERRDKKRVDKQKMESADFLLDYAFDRNKSIFTCLICNYVTKAITSHYKSQHPDSEVLISRLNKFEAEKAIQDSETKKYNCTTLEKGSTLDAVKRRVKSVLKGSGVYYCRMCKYGSVTSILQFFNHVCSHTGEYRYQCPIAGCNLRMASPESVKSHISYLHPKKKHTVKNILELFPLPSDKGTLFGYLCSACNFVQLFKRNIEAHIQKSHFPLQDVRIIKIDLSSAPPESKLSKQGGKKGALLEDSDSNDVVDDPNDIDFELSSDCETDMDAAEREKIRQKKMRIAAEVRKFRPIKPAPKDKDMTKLSDGAMQENPNQTSQAVNIVNRLVVMNTNDTKSKTVTMPGVETVEGATVQKEVFGAEDKSIERKWTIGPMKAAWLKSQSLKCSCNVDDCNFLTSSVAALKAHVAEHHPIQIWIGDCESCEVSSEEVKDKLCGFAEVIDVVKHLGKHIKAHHRSRQTERGLTKNQSGIKEKSTSSENQSKDSTGQPFPVKPLLRVRNFIGDRLSKPKGLSEDEPSESNPPSPANDRLREDEKNSSEPCLFTIKDVRSLNPKDLESDEAVFESQKGAETFPPNAEVIGGKPVIIRSCPSPKITIRSESSPIPISLAKAKQAVEVGQLKMVPSPSPTTRELAQVEIAPGTSIKILSPCTFAPNTVLVPTFTTSPCLLPLPKAGEPIQAVTVTPSTKRLVKQSANKPVFVGNPLASEIQIQSKEASEDKKKKRKQKFGAKSSLNNPADPGSQPSAQSSKPKQNSVQLKNLKDAQIYKEMLKKEKLCQLFKCMAVECSFTCNSDTIFAQHIGLHEAQARIRGKKQLNNRCQKLHNWQQCAYCCEVLIHTGSCLSQHILVQHGHCLYQCAYCFYRAICRKYVELHQKSVHETLVSESKTMIFKCKPVPGAVLTRQLDKQIKPQNVKPYLCEICGHKFYIIKHFVNHLTKVHQSVSVFSCHICKIICLKADRLIAHYKLHSYSLYHCVYCQYGTETQKEMLFHLCNFHFSQPPLICARVVDTELKSDNVIVDDLKLITFENEEPDPNYILEEVDLAAENQESQLVQISPDLTAIVSELGIDLDGKKSCPSKEAFVESGDARLPNAQFSSETDVIDDPVCIDSEVTSSNSQQKGEGDASVPIGQLPIEVLQGKEATVLVSSAKQKSQETMESVKDILVNFQQNNSAVTVSAVVEKKVDANLKSVHKLPPTVPVNRGAISGVFKSQKIALLKRLDSDPPQKKDGPSILLKQLCSPRVTTEYHLQNNVLLAVPVIETPNQIQSESTVLPAIQNVMSLKRPCDDDEAAKSTAAKKFCLTGETETEVESSLKICDVRSLSTDKTALPDAVTAGNIEIKDGKVLHDKKKEATCKRKNTEQRNSNKHSEPLSPDVIILEPDEESKNTKRELIELVDSEDEIEAKKENTDENKPNNDLDIRKQMEQLRNQIANETDCLLLDDTSQDDMGGNSSEMDRSEDSRSCLSTGGDTNHNNTNEDGDSASLDSQQVSVKSDQPSELETEKVDKEHEGDKKALQLTEGRKNEAKESTVEDIKSNTAKNENEIILTGKDLFVCGNGKCNFEAENDTELKDHLYVCDFSRESSVLVCPHCSKQLKHCTAYVDHLKLHGERKFSCGVCDFSSALEIGMIRHVKQKHKCNQIKTVPNESLKPGYFTMYPKNFKKERKETTMNVFSPGDEDKLPLQSIYQDNVKCAKCPYFTKVRSNMVRHLKIHIKSVEAEGSIVVPSTAPTNPVPCLDTKEKMFDKMTNLAASSQLAQANKDKMEMLSPEEEAKLPQFVPEQMRHKCCSPDCNYLTIDDNMLRHHIKALHDEINFYNCPHCKDTVNIEFRYVSLDKIGQHLKYHDSKLYKCLHCCYFHFQKHVVEKHVLEKHPERRFYVFTVREPKIESASEEEHSSSNESVSKVWKCGLCDDFENVARPAALEHLLKVHNMKSKFKCKFCDMKSSRRGAFASHFASNHNGQKVEILRGLVQIIRPSSEGGQKVASQDTANDHFDTTPLWQRDAPRVRHIRGILIEEEELKTKKTKRISSEGESEVSTPVTFPPDTFFCPLCADKKKVFHSKSVESFRTHLYQELNYQQYACILCGKMFVDKKDCERHHSRAHPNRDPAIKQTKEDNEIKFWVDKVVAKQQAQIIDKKRRLSVEDSKEGSLVKKKKVEAKQESANKRKPEGNRLTRSNSNVEVRSESEKVKGKRRCSEEKPPKEEASKTTRSVTASQSEEVRKCPHCDQESDLPSLKTHIQLRHLRMGKLLCPYCGDSFQQEKDARLHCRTEHPNKVPTAKLNPDEQSTELKDDFWLVEYGFGREKQSKAGSETEKSPSPPIEKEQPEKSNIYSCSYCFPVLEMTDQKSMLEHFESHHRMGQGEDRQGTNLIYYSCNDCKEKLTTVESLNVHARERHPNMTLQFEIRKVCNFETSEEACSKCRGPGSCPEKNPDRASDGNYLCPQCHSITTSYLDCIDHFNEHYPRYSCSTCGLRFLSEAETVKHGKESQHLLPYCMTIPSEKVLDEYKSGVRVKKNGAWCRLGAPCKSMDDQSENKREKKFATARKSTTQIPDRRNHGTEETKN